MSMLVIADMLIALDDMRRDGPPDRNGETQWLHSIGEDTATLSPRLSMQPPVCGLRRDRMPGTVGCFGKD